MPLEPGTDYFKQTQEMNIFMLYRQLIDLENKLIVLVTK